MQYWDPHRDYLVDQEWIDQVASAPAPAWPDEVAIARQQELFAPFTPRQLFPWASGKSPVASMPDQIANTDDLMHFVNGYDGAIRYLDHHVGQLLSTLDDLGVLDETAIIVSADHGEAMGEHGVYGDHVCAGESVHHIPLIVRWPGVAPGGRSIDGLLYNVDLQPTLCDLLGPPVPSGWDGATCVAAVRGEPWQGRSHLVWDHGLYCCQRAVRTPEWLFIRTYHPGVYPFAPVMLYDMEHDPHETENLASEQPEVVARMDHLLQSWWQDAVGHPGSLPDPMPEIITTGPWKYVTLEGWVARLSDQGLDAEADRLIARLDQARQPYAVV